MSVVAHSCVQRPHSCDALPPRHMEMAKSVRVIANPETSQNAELLTCLSTIAVHFFQDCCILQIMRFRLPLLSVVLAVIALLAQQYSPGLYNGMRWRQIGPFRAGRISAVAGVPGDPATYYLGTPGGGIWKSTSGGTTWKPIFDETHQESIG